MDWKTDVPPHHDPKNAAPQEKYDIRCLFVDYSRPSDEEGERHWRCPAWFPYDPEVKDAWTRTNCPKHRNHITASQAPMQDVKEAIRRFLGSVTRKSAAMQDSPAMTERERRLQLIREAVAAGLFTRDPGSEG